MPSATGSVLPLVGFSLMIIVAFIGLTVDVMRNVMAVRQLQFAAQSAALYAYAFATNSDGSYSVDGAKANILAKVKAAGGEGSSSPWNKAMAGPIASNNQWQSDVSFSDSTVSFVNNPNPDDNSEIFLQVSARRDGNDALNMLFLPAIYKANALLEQAVPESVWQAKPFRTAEVIGQPATRIGAGVPKAAEGQSQASDLSGFATLPLAISNQEFAQAANPKEISTSYIVDLVFDASGEQAIPGHLRGAFVNVAATGDSTKYYGTAQGDVAIDQLIQLCNYFVPAENTNVLPPGVVERGSKLQAYDPQDSIFLSRKQELINRMAQLPLNRFYIVPVVANDPKYTEDNQVVGFARLRLVQAVNSDGSDFALGFELAESVPVRNASFANGLASIPYVQGTIIPPSVSPFDERTVLADQSSVSTRPRAVVLAPALSPRIVPQLN